MAPRLTAQSEAARRDAVLQAARWCFLNSASPRPRSTTSASVQVSRGRCIYRMFKDKEDIFLCGVPALADGSAPGCTGGSGTVRQRAGAPPRRLPCRGGRALEGNVGAPMASEFIDACNRNRSGGRAAHHRRVATECVAKVLDDGQAAEVFMLALDGLLADDPQGDVFEDRVLVLASRFAADLGAAALYAQQAPREASEARDICLVGNVAHPTSPDHGLLSNDPMVRQSGLRPVQSIRTVRRKATVVQGRNVASGQRIKVRRPLRTDVAKPLTNDLLWEADDNELGDRVGSATDEADVAIFPASDPWQVQIRPIETNGAL